MKRVSKTTFAIVTFGLSLSGLLAAGAERVSWEGQGPFRLPVKAEPLDLGDRESDELVASFHLRLYALGPEAPEDHALDFDSLQVVRFSLETGRAQKLANHAYATPAFDRPFQSHDATYPETLLDYERCLPREKNAQFLRPKLIPSGKRYFNAIGEGDEGLLFLTTEGDYCFVERSS